MKFVSLLTMISLVLSLSPASQDTDIVTAFLENTQSLASADAPRPIAVFKGQAAAKAAKQADLTKDNIATILEEAKSYKHLVILTGNHTLVKVTDLEDCRQSGSWGTCMPKGEGYISRGGNLEFQQDYINNIIGIPGSQSRTAYMFN